MALIVTQERVTVPPHSTCLQRLTNWLAGFYLLGMLVYLVLRYTAQDGHWLLSLVNSFAFVLFVPLPALLLLALLAHSRRAILYLLPVVVVMLLWLVPRFLPKPVAQVTSPVLRLLSNNVWHANANPEAVMHLVRTTDPDVVMLQEVEASRQPPMIGDLGSEYPYQTRLIDEIRLVHYEGANITLSRHPFVSSKKVELGLTGMPFIYRNVIQFEGQRVALYNVHLISPVSDRSNGQPSDNYFVRVITGFDDTQRNQQIDALLTVLETEPYPYIVAGDFNTSDLSMTYSHLAAHMHDSFSEAGLGYGASWPMVEALGWPNFIPAFIRMDYIWHSDGLRTVRAWQGEYVGSDHLPMLAEFVFEQKGF